MKIERDQRGFVVFTRLHDERGCKVVVKESSAMGRKRAWIFVGGGSSNINLVSTRPEMEAMAGAHITPREARRIAKALLRFADGSR
jgi:hypothetical protein